MKRSEIAVGMEVAVGSRSRYSTAGYSNVKKAIVVDAEQSYEYNRYMHVTGEGINRRYEGGFQKGGRELAVAIQSFKTTKETPENDVEWEASTVPLQSVISSWSDWAETHEAAIKRSREEAERSIAAGKASKARSTALVERLLKLNIGEKGSYDFAPIKGVQVDTSRKQVTFDYEALEKLLDIAERAEVRQTVAELDPMV